MPPRYLISRPPILDNVGVCERCVSVIPSEAQAYRLSPAAVSAAAAAAAAPACDNGNAPSTGLLCQKCATSLPADQAACAQPTKHPLFVALDRWVSQQALTLAIRVLALWAFAYCVLNESLARTLVLFVLSLGSFIVSVRYHPFDENNEILQWAHWAYQQRYFCATVATVDVDRALLETRNVETPKLRLAMHLWSSAGLLARFLPFFGPLFASLFLVWTRSSPVLHSMRVALAAAVAVLGLFDFKDFQFALPASLTAPSSSSSTAPSSATTAAPSSASASTSKKSTTPPLPELPLYFPLSFGVFDALKRGELAPALFVDRADLAAYTLAFVCSGLSLPRLILALISFAVAALALCLVYVRRVPQHFASPADLPLALALSESSDAADQALATQVMPLMGGEEQNLELAYEEAQKVLGKFPTHPFSLLVCSFLSELPSVPLSDLLCWRERLRTNYPLLEKEYSKSLLLSPSLFSFRSTRLMRAQHACVASLLSLRETQCGRNGHLSALLDSETLFLAAQKEFQENNYCILPSLLKPSVLAVCKKYSRELDEIAVSKLSSHVEGYIQLNEIPDPFRLVDRVTWFLTIALQPVLRGLTLHAARPSWTFVRSYKTPGSVLCAHVDAGANVEWLLNICMDREARDGQEWPLGWKKQPLERHANRFKYTRTTLTMPVDKDDYVEYDLKAGDGVVLKPVEHCHFRKAGLPEGMRTTQIFIFYVSSQVFPVMPRWEQVPSLPVNQWRQM